MGAEERDRQLEQALRRQLGHGGAGDACPDAETLAAYHERTLPLDELVKLKDHVASCARCQEILATVEATEELALEPARMEEEFQDSMKVAVGAGRSVETFQAAASPAAAAKEVTEIKRRPRMVRWIAPLGAIAAVLLVWVATREHRMETVHPGSAIENQAADKIEPSAQAQGSVQSQLSANAQAPRADAPARSERIQTAPAGSVRALGKAVAKDSTGETKQAVRDKTEAVVAEKKLEMAKAAPPPAPAAAPPPAPAAQPSTNQPGPVVAGRVSEADAWSTKLDGTQKQAETANRLNENGTTTEAAQASKEKRGARKAKKTESDAYAFGTAQTSAIAARDAGIVNAPDGTTFWRFGAAGLIVYSGDGGRHWVAQSSGVAAELTSGSAVSAKVCWIAGKMGTLLVTTDGGAHWKSLKTPLSEDLGGVHAGSGQAATIWNATNTKAFETSDGGETWRQVSNE